MVNAHTRAHTYLHPRTHAPIGGTIQVRPKIWGAVGARALQVTPSRKHGYLTTLSLHPLTGRKHQLRRHCVDVLGCGILGRAVRGVRTLMRVQ